MDSILTISEDIVYGEIVRASCAENPIKIYYLPSFVGASRAAERIMPCAFILDLNRKHCAPAKSFLIEVLRIRSQSTQYEPKVFLSQSAASIFQLFDDGMKTLKTDGFSGLVDRDLVALKQFELNSLIGLLDIAMRRNQCL